MKQILIASVIATTLAVGAPRTLHDAGDIFLRIGAAIIRVGLALYNTPAGYERGGYDPGEEEPDPFPGPVTRPASLAT